MTTYQIAYKIYDMPTKQTKGSDKDHSTPASPTKRVKERDRRSRGFLVRFSPEEWKQVVAGVKREKARTVTDYVRGKALAG